MPIFRTEWLSSRTGDETTGRETPNRWAPVRTPRDHSAAGPRTDLAPDAKYLYFDTGLSPDQAVYRVRVADRKVERIASLKGFRRVINAWIGWSGVTSDGSPLLMHDIGSQEVYALDLEVHRTTVGS
jgi:hypothetical protein